MRKIIKLDIDDLLLDLNTPWLKNYNSDWRDNLKAEDIVSWAFQDYVKPECGMKIFNYLTNELYEQCYPIEGALEGVEFLRKHYEVIFVTALHVGSIEGKFFRMKELGFEPTTDNFICCSKKTLVKGNYLVDDRADTIQKAGRGGVLYTQPWNKSSTITPRCDDWDEVVRYFKKELRNK